MNTLFNFSQLPEYVTLLIQLSMVLIIFIAINIIKNFILSTAKQKLLQTHNIWDDAVISALIQPSTALIVVLYICYTLKILAQVYPEQIILADANYYIKTIGVIVIIAWFINRLISNLESNYFKNIDKDTTLDTASSYLMGKVLRAVVFTIAAIIVLQSLGYSLTALLTLGGAGSLVVGFAAKDMLANFFGGLMVYLDKPFKVGDWIKTDSNHLEGIIEKIGWRSTRIRNFDKRPVYVPNSIWVNAPVENATRMINRRIKENIGVRYCDADKLPLIIADIEELLKEHTGVDHRQTMIVRFTEFGAYSLNFMLYVFTKATKLKDFLEIKQDIFFKVIDIVHKHGADFAFPTTTIDLPEKVVQKLT